MNTPILQHLLKLLVSLLLALMPFYTLLAQDKEKKETPEKIRVKMFKSVNGELVYSKDTVINAADHEQQLKAIEGLRFDTKTWKKLDNLKVDLDTASLGKLKKMRVYRADKFMSDKEREMLFEKIQGVTGDSFKIKTIKEGRVMIVHSDSAHSLGFNKISFDGVPGKMFSISHSGPDSVHVIVREINPAGAMSIRSFSPLSEESVTARYTTSDKIKIETDESGKTTVYEIDEKGNKKEIDGYHFGRTGEKSTVILLNKTKVIDITKEDKKALKEAGVKVEKSEKKELKAENLSYYPNPSNGRFNVSFTLPDKKAATVRVLNSTGKQVYQEKVDNPTSLIEKQINLSGMEKGIYYLQIEQGGKTITKRLLIQ